MVDKAFITSVVILLLLAILSTVFIALYFTKPFTSGLDIVTFSKAMFNFDDGQSGSCTSLTQWGNFSKGTYFGVLDVGGPSNLITVRTPTNTPLYSLTNNMSLVFGSAGMEYTTNFDPRGVYVTHSPSFTAVPTFSLNFSYTNNTAEILQLCYFPA